ncbi:MAG: NADH-quinone oxidoreductase subunit J [Candidatus Omnitrophica bacterium]|nr:NADH-quinone oxidoreductase subunit J [Candidatus Omnitrophota bacterium]
MSDAIWFYTLTTFMVGSALGVVLARKPIYAVLSLVATLFGMASLFILLGAFFVAAIQILVYAGAILVLFLFVVMLLDLSDEAAPQKRTLTLRAIGFVFGAAFISKLYFALSFFPNSPLAIHESMKYGTAREIGKLLFTVYWLPFELSSMLVLVGIIGAVVLAKRKLDES